MALWIQDSAHICLSSAEKSLFGYAEVFFK